MPVPTVGVDWFSQVSDTKQLWESVIVGAHGAGTSNAPLLYSSAKCQTKSVKDLLIAGVRSFHFGLNKHMQYANGSIVLPGCLNDALYTFMQFLISHPQELILVWVNPEGDLDTAEEWTERLSFILKGHSSIFFDNESDLFTSTVQALRGKICFITSTNTPSILGYHELGRVIEQRKDVTGYTVSMNQPHVQRAFVSEASSLTPSERLGNLIDVFDLLADENRTGIPTVYFFNGSRLANGNFSPLGWTDEFSASFADASLTYQPQLRNGSILVFDFIENWEDIINTLRAWNI